MIRRIIDFVTRGVWESDHTRHWWAVRQLRVILFTARGFGRHDTAVRSAALAFYTVMSLVPILALVFVIFKGFGMEAAFSNYLYRLLPNYTELVDQVVVFIGNLLGRTHGGVMAVSAFFVLIWAVIQVFGSVEGAFNNIWEVKRSRSFARRLTAYMALIILVPILLLAANSLFVGVRQRVQMFTGNFGAEVLFSFAGVVLVVLMFALIYFVLPNTPVRFKNALKAGAVAGIGFSVFQVVYVWMQGSLSSYNAIYGTFAAIPLFLIWLQTSWQILLFGGELSFAMQNIHDFVAEREAKSFSYDNRCKIMVATMVIVIRNYLDGGGASTTEAIAGELGLPVRSVRDVANELEDDQMLLFVQSDGSDKDDAMVPARDPHSMRFFDVINAATSRGSAIAHLKDSPLMNRIEATYDKTRGDIASSRENILLTELI